MTKFTARQFAKFGFVRDESQDFSDDGARFRVWMYNGVRVTYTTCCGDVFISPHFNLNGKSFTYSDFHEALTAKGIDPDCFNGIENDKDVIDLEYLKKQIDLTLQFIEDFDVASKNEPLTKEVRERIEYEIKTMSEAIDFVRNFDWLGESVNFEGTIKGTYCSITDLRSCYINFSSKIKKLQSIDANDAHLYNSRFKRSGYLEMMDKNCYLGYVKLVREAISK